MKQGFQAMDTLVVDLLDRVQEMADNPNDVTGVPTGFYDLDRMTAGLQAGDLIVLAASAQSMGKTAFAINIAETRGIERRPAGGRVFDGNGCRAVGGAYRWLDRPHRPEPPAHRQADPTRNGRA
jgi:replicative DNA helicase